MRTGEACAGCQGEPVPFVGEVAVSGTSASEAVLRPHLAPCMGVMAGTTGRPAGREGTPGQGIQAAC